MRESKPAEMRTRLGLEGAGGGHQRVLDGAEDFGAARSGGEREIHGGSLRCAFAGFIGAAGAGIERPLVAC